MISFCKLINAEDFEKIKRDGVFDIEVINSSFQTDKLAAEFFNYIIESGRVKKCTLANSRGFTYNVYQRIAQESTVEDITLGIVYQKHLDRVCVPLGPGCRFKRLTIGLAVDLELGCLIEAIRNNSSLLEVYLIWGCEHPPVSIDQISRSVFVSNVVIFRSDDNSFGTEMNHVKICRLIVCVVSSGSGSKLPRELVPMIKAVLFCW